MASYITASPLILQGTTEGRSCSYFNEGKKGAVILLYELMQFGDCCCSIVKCSVV